MTNFRLFQTESLQTTILNLMKKSKKFSKWIENNVGKGDIACYEQFLFPQCFHKTCTSDTSKPWLVWERLVSEKVMEPDGEGLEKHCGKRRKC